MFRYCLFIVVALLAIIPTAKAEISASFLMDFDPEIRDPDRVKDFHPGFKSLWLQALQRPEADMQRRAAETVARATQYGFSDLNELVPALETILEAPSSHQAARHAAAHALIVLNSRESAAKLFEAGLQNGLDLRQLVETALAKWRYEAAKPFWMNRLESSDVHPQDLILAVNGLGRLQDSSALASIQKITMDLVRAPALRLDAAAAAGQIAESGLESSADQLGVELRGSPRINRLCAVLLLSRHTSGQAIKRLTELAVDSDASVSSAALSRLNEINFDLVLPLAEVAMKNVDSQIRTEGAKAYLSRPTPERIPLVARLLSDPHPELRALIAERLAELAGTVELNDVIRTEAMRELSGDRWQGQSQAALLLGQLKHQAAADRMVELLESPRPELMTNVAWGLRKLEEPRTIPAIIDKIRRQTEARRTNKIPGVDHQVAHLIEACTVMRTRLVEPLIALYIPKNMATLRSRGAAIWSIGLLRASDPDPRIVDALLQRFTDDSPSDPEHPFVRQMCAVTFARMKATEAIPAMRKYMGTRPRPNAWGMAMRWSIHELTGEEIPLPHPDKFPQGKWFLEPLAEE